MKTKILIIIIGLLPFHLLQSQSLAEVENELKLQLKGTFLQSFVLSPASSEYKCILSKNIDYVITGQYVGKKNCNITIDLSADNKEPIISLPTVKANNSFGMALACQKTGIHIISAKTNCKEDYNIVCIVSTATPVKGGLNLPPQPPMPTEAKERITSKEEPNKSIDGVFIIVEEPAAFKKDSDLNTFRKWVQDNVVLPDEVVKAGISGKVFVQFVVDEEGNVINEKILRGVTEKIDQMVIETIQKSPKWEKPPRNGGKAVKQAFTIPVVVKLM
jgi:TonB family protein